MSENTNNKGGFLDQVAENKLKPLVSQSTEQVNQSERNAVEHERFGQLKRHFRTEGKDVIFARLSLTLSVAFLMLALYWRNLMNSRFTLHEQFAHPEMVIIVVVVHAFFIFVLPIIHLFLSKEYDVIIYEKGVELVGTRNNQTRSMAYNQIADFKKRGSSVAIKSFGGEKIVFSNLNVAKVKEIGETLNRAITESRRKPR